jgi:hypothetical protein
MGLGVQEDDNKLQDGRLHAELGSKARMTEQDGKELLELRREWNRIAKRNPYVPTMDEAELSMAKHHAFLEAIQPIQKKMAEVLAMSPGTVIVRKDGTVEHRYSAETEKMIGQFKDLIAHIAKLHGVDA